MCVCVCVCVCACVCVCVYFKICYRKKGQKLDFCCMKIIIIYPV